MLDLQTRAPDRYAPLHPSHVGASHKILGTRFNLISYEDVMAAIVDWRERGLHHYVAVTPPYSVLMCLRDAALKKATDGAALTLPDGVGDILAARLLGYPHHGRVAGPMLMLRLCDWGRAYGIRHLFHGGLPGVAEALCDRLTKSFPGLIVAGTCCPPFTAPTATEDAKMVDRINSCRPDIVWVGLGSPKQEKWMAEHRERIHAVALIGVGAAFDFHSGRVKWAPEWVRKAGLEWAYRLMGDPKRMWRRNVNSVVFLTKVLAQCARASFGREPTFMHRDTRTTGGTA